MSSKKTRKQYLRVYIQRRRNGYVCKNKQEEAYFTVEASLIMPIVLLSTVMMIFLAFYSYDRCILECSAYEAAMRGTGGHLSSAREAEEAACAAAGMLVEEKLFAIHDLQYQVKVDANKVTVRYHCTVNMPLLTWLSEYVSGINLDLDISRMANRNRPARMIRDCKILNQWLYY